MNEIWLIILMSISASLFITAFLFCIACKAKVEQLQRTPLVQWEVHTPEGVILISAASAQVDNSGDLVFTARNGSLLKAYAKGHWIGCDKANPPAHRKGG